MHIQYVRVHMLAIKRRGSNGLIEVKQVQIINILFQGGCWWLLALLVPDEQRA